MSNIVEMFRIWKIPIFNVTTYLIGIESVSNIRSRLRLVNASELTNITNGIYELE